MGVKHHVYLLKTRFRAQELCESRGGRPGLPVPNSRYGLCGRKSTLNWKARVVLNTQKMCKCFRFLASYLASISVYAAEVVCFLASNLSSSERSHISSLLSSDNNDNCDVYCSCPSVKSKQKQTNKQNQNRASSTVQCSRSLLISIEEREKGWLGVNTHPHFLHGTVCSIVYWISTETLRDQSAVNTCSRRSYLGLLKCTLAGWV